MKNDSQLNRALHISRSNCSITCNGVASCLHIYYDISSMDWSGFIKGGSTRVYVVAWCLRINILEEFSEWPHSCALKWLTIGSDFIATSVTSTISTQQALVRDRRRKIGLIAKSKLSVLMMLSTSPVSM